MKQLLFLAFLWMGLPAMATIYDWPALYDVIGVAGDDSLNIRAEPNGSADIIGELAHDASNIEVVAINEAETWGLVNIGEASGWVSLYFMVRQPEQFAGKFPELASCYGTEPFWSLGFESDSLTYRDADGETSIGVDFWKIVSSSRFDRFGFGSEMEEITGIVAARSCSDGMSDRNFGFSVEVILGSGAQSRLLSGCCSLQTN